MNPVHRLLLVVCLTLFVLIPVRAEEALAVVPSPAASSPMPADDGAAAASPGAAAPALHSYSADYKVTRKIFDSDVELASANLRLELGADGGYRYSSSLRMGRLIQLFYGEELVEYTRGRVESGGVRPDLYEMRLKGRKPREGSIVFEREAGTTVVQRFKGKEVRQKVPPDAHDRLSLQLEMARDLAAGRRAMQYLMVDRGRLRVYRFEVKAEERLDTPIGSYDTLRVELTGRLRVKDREAAKLDVSAAQTESDLSGEHRTVFWAAPALEYVPIRILHEDEDLGVFTMSVERLQLPLVLDAQDQGVAGVAP